MRVRRWAGRVEEWPFNLWDVEVTDWVWRGLVLARRIFYRTCMGMDSRTAKQRVEWRFVSAMASPTYLTENEECPKGCLLVTGRHERE